MPNSTTAQSPITPTVSAKSDSVETLFTEFNSITSRYIALLQHPQMAVPMQAHEVQRLTNEWKAQCARFAVNGLSQYLEAIARSSAAADARAGADRLAAEKRVSTAETEARRMRNLTIAMVIAALLQAFGAVWPYIHPQQPVAPITAPK